VDDLAEVTAVYGSGRLPVTFVTPAGDLLWPSGIVSGGPRTDGLLARVREVRDLEHEVVGLDARVAASEAGNVAAESELARAADLLENLRNRHHTAALAVANHEKDLERAHERVKALGEAQESRAVERSEILSEIESIAEERVRLVERLDGLRRDRGDKQRDLDALGLNIGSSGREVTRLETIATERRVEYAGLQEKCDRLRRSGLDLAATASETREWIVVREGEIASAEQRRRELATTIDECSVALTVSLEREEQARASNDEKREAFERVSGVVGVLEEAARELRTRLAERREG
jgi:chromosome segregation ATPase